jgi:hypothetical protein
LWPKSVDNIFPPAEGVGKEEVSTILGHDQLFHLKKIGCGPNQLIISFPPAEGGGKRRSFNNFET